MGDQATPYRPIYAMPYWDVIGSFIEDAVADVAAAAGRQPRPLYPATTAFVLWCWQSRGTPLERKRIFHPAVVEQFIHLGMTDYVRGSRATHRATLWLMVNVLNPNEDSRTRRAIPRSAPMSPYSQAEVAALASWSQAQGTRRRRLDATALLAMGLGAGLATREILSVRNQDVEVWPQNIYVNVTGARERIAPVRPQWHRLLSRILEDADPTAFIFRPGRKGASDGQVTDFLLRSRTTLDIRPIRMRTTWLLEHLTIGTSPSELLQISGLRTLGALDKIAAFSPTTGGAVGFRK